MLLLLFQSAAAREAGKIVRNKDSGVGMLMNLRKIANHPLLTRNLFDQSQVRQLARLLKKDATHEKAVEKFIAEDLSVMSDFDIHKTCLAYRVSSFLRNYRQILPKELVCNTLFL